ncbi:MAG: HEAT repeat domain-containing protein, partial [Chlamydiia bacterium]|nr:HEAT repeat domain-containing protein [Chlamydiia bacterium]
EKMTKKLIDPNAQRDLIRVLGKSGSRSSLRILAEKGRGAQKWLALLELEKLSEHRPLAELHQALIDAPAEEKEYIVEIIIRRAHSDSIPVLRRLLIDSKDSRLRQKTLQLMADMLNQDYETLMLDILKSYSTVAESHFHSSHSPHHDAASQPRLETNDKNELRAQIALSLGKARSKKAIPLLIALLGDHDPMVQKAARVALELTQDPEAQEYIKEHHQRRGEGHVH